MRLDHDASSLVVPGPIVLEAPLTTTPIVTGTRIGITKAIELEWRFCDPASAHVSRPLPDVMRRGRLSRAGR